MMDISVLELEGITYPVIIRKNIHTTEVVYDFYVTVNGKEYKTHAKLTPALVNDLKTFQGLDPDEEVKNILIYELKQEIFEIIYGQSIEDQLDKIFTLIKTEKNTDEDLLLIAETDEVFAAYLRNFHNGVLDGY